MPIFGLRNEVVGDAGHILESNCSPDFFAGEDALLLKPDEDLNI